MALCPTIPAVASASSIASVAVTSLRHVTRIRPILSRSCNHAASQFLKEGRSFSSSSHSRFTPSPPRPVLTPAVNSSSSNAWFFSSALRRLLQPLRSVALGNLLKGAKFPEGDIRRKKWLMGIGSGIGVESILMAVPAQSDNFSNGIETMNSDNAPPYARSPATASAFDKRSFATASHSSSSGSLSLAGHRSFSTSSTAAQRSSLAGVSASRSAYSPPRRSFFSCSHGAWWARYVRPPVRPQVTSIYDISNPRHYQAFINDSASVLTADQYSSLHAHLVNMAAFHGVEFTLLTIGGIQGIEASGTFTAASDIFHHWNVSGGAKDNSILLVLFLEHRKLEIVTGSRVKEVIHSGILDGEFPKSVLPLLQKGQYGEGIVNAVGTIGRQLRGSDFWGRYRYRRRRKLRKVLFWLVLIWIFCKVRAHYKDHANGQRAVTITWGEKCARTGTAEENSMTVSSSKSDSNSINPMETAKGTVLVQPSPENELAVTLPRPPLPDQSAKASSDNTIPAPSVPQENEIHIVLPRLFSPFFPFADVLFGKSNSNVTTATETPSSSLPSSPATSTNVSDAPPSVDTTTTTILLSKNGQPIEYTTITHPGGIKSSGEIVNPATIRGSGPYFLTVTSTDSSGAVTKTSVRKCATAVSRQEDEEHRPRHHRWHHHRCGSRQRSGSEESSSPQTGGCSFSFGPESTASPTPTAALPSTAAGPGSTTGGSSYDF